MTFVGCSLPAAAILEVQVVGAVPLMAKLVAVGESLKWVAREVHLNPAVDAVEVLLLSVVEDALATKEIQLFQTVGLLRELKLSICVLCEGETRLFLLLPLSLLFLGGLGSDLLLLLDSGLLLSGLLALWLRLLDGDEHLLPIVLGRLLHLGGNWSLHHWLGGGGDHALIGAGGAALVLAVGRGVLDHFKGQVDTASELVVVAQEDNYLLDGLLNELADHLSCEVLTNDLLDVVVQKETKLALVV